MKKNMSVSDENRIKLIEMYRENPSAAARDLLGLDLAPHQRVILKSMWDCNNVIIILSRGSGKCVTGDTCVLTNKGFSEIKELCSESYGFAKQNEIIYGENGFNMSSHTYKNIPKEIYKISTSNNYSINSVDKHMVRVFSRGNIEWKRADEIKEGDFAVIDRNTGYYFHGEYDYLSCEEGYIIGALVGDGCFVKNGNVGFTNTDKDIIDYFDKNFNSVGALKFSHLKDKNEFSLNFGSSDNTDNFFNKYLLKRCKSNEKEIPKSILHSNKSVLSSFISGLMDTDGGMVHSGIEYSSVSIKLIKQVQNVLLSFGIISRWREKRIKYKDSYKTSYVMTITSENVKRFMDNIGFRCSRKKELCEKFCNNRWNPNKDVIYGIDELLISVKKIYLEGKVEYKQDKNSRRILNNTHLKEYGISYRFLGEFLELTSECYKEDCYKKLKDIYDRNYFFDRVKKVEILPCEDTYDFSIPDDHTFVSNGFISHNTFIDAVFAILRALLFPGEKVGIFSSSYRQCLQFGGNNIFTNNGMINTSEIFGDDITHIQSNNESNKILNKWMNNDSDGYEIKTSGMYSFSAKNGHKILVSTENGIEYKNINDIVVGDVLPIRIGFNYFGEKVDLPNDDYVVTGYDNHIKIPTKITKDFAYFLGLICGDGCITKSKSDKNYRISFVSGDDELGEKYLRIMSDVFDITNVSVGRKKNSNGKDGKCKYYNVNSKHLYKFLEKCGLSNCGALNKSIPDVIKSAPKKYVCEFLKGLFDTDGFASFSDKKSNSIMIGLSTSSKKMAEEVRDMLLNIGIFSKITESTKQGKKEIIKGKTSNISTGYRVYISSAKYISKYMNEISFSLSRKRAFVESNIKHGSRWCDRMIYPKNVMDALKKKIMDKYGKEVGAGYFYKSLGQIQSKYITPERINLFLDLIIKLNCDIKEIDEYNLLKNMYKNDYAFVEVMDKNSKIVKTFDIEVENEHCYWAGGFIHHNSKFVFEEVSRIYDISPILRDCCEKKPTKMVDMCYLQFKSTGNKPGSVIHALPLGDGCHNCLTTNYLQQNGFINFGDKKPKKPKEKTWYKDKEKVWSNGEYRDSDGLYYNGERDTKIITTKKGFEIESTLNHKYKIFDGSNIRWKTVEELSVGDRILIDKSVRWHRSDTSLTCDECYAFGAIIGDGNLTKQSGIGFASTEKDNDILSFIKQGTPFLWNKCSDDVHWWGSGGDKMKNDYLSKFGYSKGNYATINKVIPKIIMNSSKEKMSAFISGLFDTDGGVYTANKDGSTSISVCFYNTSEILIKQLQYILLHYGITANISKRKREHDNRFGDVNWNNSYELHITGKDVLIFANEIGFRLPRKKKILEEEVKRKKRWLSIKDDEVPINKDELISFRKNHKPDAKYVNNRSYIIVDNIKNKKYITKDFIKKFLVMYNKTEHPYLDKLKEFCRDDVYYDTVDSLVDSKAETMDIQVPDGNEYCANGFFSHNSTIRGARYFTIIADETAQIPTEILDVVVRGMMATSKNPMEQVRIRENQKKLLKEGKIEKLDKLHNNKIVLSSTAYYQYNHLWKRVQGYMKLMEEKGKKAMMLKKQGLPVPDELKVELRGHDLNNQIPFNIMKDDSHALICFGYEDMPDGFMNIESINEAKREMPRYQFLMEYNVLFPSDSDGFFPASLLDKARNHGEFTCILSSEKSNEWINIMACDPARSGDNFAIAIMSANVKTNQIRLIRMLTYNKMTFPFMHMEIRRLRKLYNISEISMDSGGGGQTIRDLLADQKLCPPGDDIILQRDFDEHMFKQGKRILRLVEFSNYEWLCDANNNLLLGLQNGTFKIACEKGSLKKATDFDESPEEEDARKEIDKTIDEIQNIVVTRTSNARMHWDTPQRNQRKDRYSAVLIGYDQAYSYIENLNRPQSLAGGFWAQ